MENKIQVRALHPFDHYGMVRRHQILTVTQQTAAALSKQKLVEIVGGDPAPIPPQPAGEGQPSSASQAGPVSPPETSSESDDGETSENVRPQKRWKRRGK